MSKAIQRIDVHFHGQVQGVGFRYTTRSISSLYEVTGFVRNLADGRVHLVVEGGSEEISGFLDQIRSRLGHYIREEQSSTSSATGEFDTFDVAF